MNSMGPGAKGPGPCGSAAQAEGLFNKNQCTLRRSAAPQRRAAPRAAPRGPRPEALRLKIKKMSFWDAGVVQMVPQQPGDHFYHIKTPNVAI